MRKTISTIALAAGLAFGGVPAIASAATLPTCSTETVGMPCVSDTDGQWSAIAAQLQTALNAQVAENAVLRAQVAELQQTIQHQRAVIRHLRAKLARG